MWSHVALCYGRILGVERITASIGNRGWGREASEGKGLALKCRWLSSGPHTSARWATQVDAFTPGMRQKGSVPPSEACP